MDYSELARKFMLHMAALRRCGENRMISDSLRGETFIINLIAFHGGDLLPSEISSRMGISAARITAVLNSLEKKGFITRRIDPENRRRIIIELTESGKEQAGQNFDMLISKISGMLSKLGEYDSRELVRIIGKLAESLPECEK